jgi:hypothetical protein
MSSSSASSPLKVLLFGVASVALYGLMAVYEKEVLTISAQGGWNFIYPVAIAFIFSYFHGGFTHEFWDYLGVKAKSDKKK